MQFVTRFSNIAAVLLLAVVAPWTAGAHEEKVVHHDFEEQHGNLASVGKKLNDPTSNVWAMFTQFSMTLSDGNVNSGSPVPAGQVSFQPIMPVPLYGAGKDQWKMIVRPTLPIAFSQPIPTGFDEFRYSTGLGDLELPMVVSPAPSIT